MYTYTHVYQKLSIYVCIYSHVHACMHICICMCVNPDIHIYLYVLHFIYVPQVCHWNCYVRLRGAVYAHRLEYMAINFMYPLHAYTSIYIYIDAYIHVRPDMYIYIHMCEADRGSVNSIHIYKLILACEHRPRNHCWAAKAGSSDTLVSRITEGQKLTYRPLEGSSHAYICTRTYTCVHPCLYTYIYMCKFIHITYIHTSIC